MEGREQKFVFIFMFFYLFFSVQKGLKVWPKLYSYIISSYISENILVSGQIGVICSSGSGSALWIFFFNLVAWKGPVGI